MFFFSRSMVLVGQSKWNKIFRLFRENQEKRNISAGILFFLKYLRCKSLFHLIYHQINRIFRTKGKCPKRFLLNKYVTFKSIFSSFSWELQQSQEKRKTMLRQNFGGQTKSITNIKWSDDPRSYKRNFSNWGEKPEKFRTSAGFEPVSSRHWCNALINWAMKPPTLGAGHLWVLMFPW